MMMILLLQFEVIKQRIGAAEAKRKVHIGPSEVHAPAVGVAHAGGERIGPSEVRAPAVGVAHAGGERSVHY